MASTDKTLARIAALLRHAEGTTNQHEAEAFLAAAQRLATSSAIDLALARLHDPSPHQNRPIQQMITLGKPGERGLRTYGQLFVGIAQANDVLCDIASNATCVYAYGFRDDIHTTHTLYRHLVVQMVQASKTYIASGAHRPLASITARIHFQLAYSQRIGMRLMHERQRTRTHREHHAGVSSSVAVALRDKDTTVTEYYHHHSHARGTWRASRRSARLSAGPWRAGDQAASQVRLIPSQSLSHRRVAIEP